MNRQFFNPVLIIVGGFILALSLISCGSNEQVKFTPPDNILSEERFTKLLTTYALAESAANMNIKGVPSFRLDTVYAFNPLAENNVRQSQYDSTVAFYIEHPALYKKIYENVLASLTLLQTKKDSIKAAKGSK